MARMWPPPLAQWVSTTMGLLAPISAAMLVTLRAAAMVWLRFPTVVSGPSGKLPLRQPAGTVLSEGCTPAGQQSLRLNLLFASRHCVHGVFGAWNPVFGRSEER